MAKKIMDCVIRESNLGRPRGRQAFYHWTNNAVIYSSFVRSQTPDQNTAYQRDGWWRPTHMGSKIGRGRTVATEEQCWIQGWMNSYGSIGRSLLFILFGPNLMFEPRVEHWRRFPVPDTPHSLRSLIVFHNFLHISGRPYLWQSFYSKAFKSIRRT